MVGCHTVSTVHRGDLQGVTRFDRATFTGRALFHGTAFAQLAMFNQTAFEHADPRVLGIGDR